MEELLRAFAEEPDFGNVMSGVRQGFREQLVSGLAGSAKAVMIAAAARELGRPVLVLAHNMFAAQKIAEDLNELLPESALLYPAHELTVAEGALASPDLLSRRIDALSRLAVGNRGIVVAPYAGVRKLVPPPRVFAESRVELSVGQELPLEAFVRRLSEIGYERAERVERPGEMAVRGGIVDFFPLNEPLPYRVEWFDDEIDSIRTFDPADQRSVDKRTQITVWPARETVTDGKRLQQAAMQVADRLEEQLGKMTDRLAKERLRETILHDVERLREQASFTDIYKYIAVLYPERTTLFDYMPDDTLLFIDEPLRLIETARQMDRDEGEMIADMLAAGKMLPGTELAKSMDEVLHAKPFQTVYLSLFLRQVPQASPQNVVGFVCRQMQNFHGQMHVLKAEMERWTKSGTRVMVLAAGRERADRVRRVLTDYQIPVPEIVDGNLQNGFELPSVRLAVITEGEVFSQRQRKVRKSDRKIENAERIKSYLELKPGDYVVHIHHGIGKFLGIGTLEVAGIHRDYLHIQYAGGDRLSVPIDQIDLVQKYVGADDKEPKLSKMGGADWQRAKSRARKSVQDIADDLIRLYAERQAAPGFAFSPDTPYQAEFEAMFPYEETPDQLRAIREIKADMEKSRPMDRLLCGDVGYGKTEVAIRAAFKAVMDGKQVAVLVPTTILAQQHHETFRERFSGFPVSIHVLSRFRSRKEQQETIRGLAAGTVDIVIGTHRLLSKDVKFKDLGLLIVDEEQRFGVTHKEKLKMLKANVDVLTLTATPIPRTLHMSMLGVRDLSIIETPPENRFPVQTYVVEFSPTLVREAIERELARGGQVYFLYNRVQGIHQMADFVQSLVPDARIAVAHGQMAEQELEATILDFLEGEFDVLVSTTIIETGVDIPNVNTLIVYDADKMGLAQLYQLRGRVGRSNRIAYAYLTYQKDKVLNEVSEKRLQAIKEFTELGSGFKIAMRDLAIRGAGNLLGPEQHGFIASVGFELYSQMLAEEIRKRKAAYDGVEAAAEPEPVNVQIDLDIDAYLPSSYIYDSIQKIEVYKKVAVVDSLEAADDLHDELTDRFGDPPREVERLLAVARLRVHARALGIESFRRKGSDVVIRFLPGRKELPGRAGLNALPADIRARLQATDDPVQVLTVKGKGLDADGLLDLLEQLMTGLERVLATKGDLHHAAQ